MDELGQTTTRSDHENAVAGRWAAAGECSTERKDRRARRFGLALPRLPWAILSVLSLSAAFALPAAATGYGSLDTTFSADGKVLTNFGGYSDSGQSVAVQSDGKLVVGGVSYGTISTGNFALTRYNVDGSLDTSFGVGGMVTTSFGANVATIWSVAIYKTGPHLGKIVAVGDSTASGRNVFALARYNTDGSLDTSFDTDGKVTTAFGTISDISPMAQAFSVALQSDDKIVLAGGFFRFYSTGWDMALARYNDDGSLDTSFGGTGKVITDIGGFPYGGGDAAYSVAIQSDGKILAGGYGNPFAQDNSDFALVRYNMDGTLDTSFGGTGKVTTDLGSTTDYGKSVAIQSDGRILLTGQYGDYPSADFALARYNADGSLDSSFGSGGHLTTNFGGWDLGQAMALQADGKILAAGYTQSASYAIDFALARYNTDGSLDADFGTAGKVTTDFDGGPDAGKSIAIQSDGKIVVAGSGGVTHTDFAVARYNAELLISNSPPVADAGGNVTITSDQVDTTVILGSATDPDDDILSFRWLEGVTVLQDWSYVGASGEADLDLAFVSLLPSGTSTLTLEVDDGTVTSTDEMILTVGNSAPNVSPTGGGTYQIGDLVILGGQVSDFDGDELDYQWSEGATLLFAGTIQASPGGTPVTLTNESIDDLGLGIHTLTLLVDDGINPAVAGSIAVNVIDDQAPTLAPVADRTILWPPNHKMVTVTILANAGDSSGYPVTLTASVVSNEPADGLGDGDTSPDWTLPVINDGTITVQLRAERSGKGTGRIYTITITAIDGANNASTAQVQVFVPHDQKGK